MLACALRCGVLPISQTRRLSPTANAVPPLSEKEGFYVHHPLPSFMSNSLRGCTFPYPPSMWKEGDRVSGRGWRTWWLMRVRCMLACALRCSVLPISRTRRLSPTASAVPPLSEKEGFYVHHPLPSFMSNSLRGCTFPSLLPCGRRGTALAVEDGELGGS